MTYMAELLIIDNCMVQSPGGDVRNLTAIRKINGGPSVSGGLTCVLQYRDLGECNGWVSDALLRYYEAYSGNSLPAFRDNPRRDKKSKKNRITFWKSADLIYFRWKH